MSGWARVVSSVTYITRRPSCTANVIASSVLRSSHSSVQPSAYWRIGELPMNRQASIGTPVRCWISAIGRMSSTWVRAAQLAATDSRWLPISRARRSASRATSAPAPGRPMSAVWMPSVSMRWRMRSLSSIDGVRTDGDCRPSRSVSSSSITVRGRRGALTVFQS